MLRNFAARAPSTALSRSASSKTTNGALPPSSIETRSTPSAAWAMSLRPTSVEPVNDSLRRRGSAMIGPESAEDFDVCTTLTTPFGSPAFSSSEVKKMVVSGVRAGGLMTTVQPAARAGAILRVAIANGKFHGVTKNDGPTGRCDTTMWPVPSGLMP